VITDQTILSLPAVAATSIGSWTGEGAAPHTNPAAWPAVIQHVGRPVYAVDVGGKVGLADHGVATLRPGGPAIPTQENAHPLLAYAPALLPDQLGDPAFRAAHGLRYAYVAGAMANAITSEELVEAMGRGGMLGFFGAAGLDVDRVERAIDRIQSNLGNLPYGFNLIHSPADPRLEEAVVDLYLRRGVSLVSASAYLGLTLPLVRYRVTGINRDSEGNVITPNFVVAKVSRVEVARKFFSPPPDDMLERLVRDGAITAEQAKLARTIPMAEDLTAEADSGGHTDNRPAIALLPTMLALRDELQAAYAYKRRLRVGAAGGIAAPASVVAAFAMGASYVLTGSINQACIEAGTSPAVREMLAQASQADVVMAPAADMFEMGG
jgi:PfaD family protein